MFAKGDTVKHIPTGEEWLLIRAEGDYVYPGGWPASRALAADCRLLKAADPKTVEWIDRQLSRASTEAG